jgi:AcrR family transcriptional regulator
MTEPAMERAMEGATEELVEFQRARSEEQREQRRRAILRVAADMVAEMPVADITLNELSRRVGFAKSNVLRYFESREAVLLELLDKAWRDWLQRLAADLPGGVDTGYPRVAAIITASLVDDRLFCELLSVSSAVLERNVSAEVARRYKLAAIANTEALSDLIDRAIAELDAPGSFAFAAGTLVAITGIWPLTHPSEAMRRVYEDPAMARLRLDFRGALEEMLTTLLAGCLARWPTTGGDGTAQSHH